MAGRPIDDERRRRAFFSRTPPALVSREETPNAIVPTEAFEGGECLPRPHLPDEEHLPVAREGPEILGDDPFHAVRDLPHPRHGRQDVLLHVHGL
jgi:hypothetical protein